MSSVEKGYSILRILATLAIIGLFIADYAFDVMAKSPPIWAYIIPGLLALGIESAALGRLIMQAVKGMAGISDEDPKI